MNENATQARLAREAQTCFLATLGDRDGVNVAKVEVSWYYSWQGEHGGEEREEHAGYFLVHATGDEDVDSIYETFETLVGAAMEERQARLGFYDWQTDDTYAA